MIFVGLIISAVAVFLGVFTKFPQGCGGLANNLMVMSLLHSNPPLLPPPPPPRANIYDYDAAVLEIWQYHTRDPLSAGSVTEGSMPSPLAKHRTPAGSKNTPAPNSTFQFSGFSSLAFPLHLHFIQLCYTIGVIVARTAMVAFVLCSPWLAARKMHLLDMNVSARKGARTPLVTCTGFEHNFWQIQSHSPLFDDLQIAISERDEALVELMQITEKATEDMKKALERDSKTGEDLERLHEERDDALVQVARGKRNLEKLQKEKKDEAEGLKQEMKEQTKAWEEKEKDWEKNRVVDNKSHQDDKESINMGRVRERDSWKKRVEKLETEKKREKEGMDGELKNISEVMKKEREGWVKEREKWHQDKAEQAREKEMIEAARKKLEEQANEEKKSWEEANDRVQGRIVKLQDENQTMRNEAGEKEKLDKERETARKAYDEARGERQKRREEELRTAARVATSKLEEEVLNGRKLIEDLQGDKRRDRQLLLELRAQLARPTFATPPTHINPLRFGGSAQIEIGGPIVPSPSVAPYTSPSASPQATLPPVLPSNPPSISPLPIPSNMVVKQELLFASPPSRPIVRLPPPPPPRQVVPAQLPAPSLAPKNAPKGPKGWMPGGR